MIRIVLKFYFYGFLEEKAYVHIYSSQSTLNSTYINLQILDLVKSNSQNAR